ncbi:Protein CBFA2T3 [Lamellibrachia satsuma]|nr:Protein CBFA2T3 [Lamellibrachia satsuma]
MAEKGKPLICLRDLSNYRLSTMPELPAEGKLTTPAPLLSPVTHMPSVSPVISLPPLSVNMSRPPSTSSSASGLNGSHSPHGSLHNHTPSPPSAMAPGALSAGPMATQQQQQLPPACGARQLSKLKRFLTTLQQFGSDISGEIGERVRSLVLALVNSQLTIEDFHAKLQEATNFPLRPFVIPFLKANLPLLQRELLHCARLAKQTPQQYLAHNEHILFDPAHAPRDSLNAQQLNDSGKRKSPDRPKENGLESHGEPMHPAKRAHTLSPISASRISPTNPAFNFHLGGPLRLEDISLSRELRERERLERERLERERMETERHYNNYSYHRGEHPFEHVERMDDDWKYVENMLHCIVGMVDKCKRALSVLRERSQREGDDLSLWARQHEGLDPDMKSRASDIVACTLRQTEDRVADVKRTAEDAVNEVKRQAVAEMQKAVAAAEAKAAELITAERTKMDRTISEVRKQAHSEAVQTVGQQEDSSESCWNCGRKASETCSGCNVARYCGSFCQHKDWENHHRVCGQALSSRHRGGSSSGQQADSQSKPQTPTLETNVTASSSPLTETSPTATTASMPVSRPMSSSPDITKTEDATI